MTNPKAKARSYIIRDINPALWKRFKARATSEGRGQKYIVLRLIELYSAVGLSVIEQAVEASRKTRK